MSESAHKVRKLEGFFYDVTKRFLKKSFLYPKSTSTKIQATYSRSVRNCYSLNGKEKDFLIIPSLVFFFLLFLFLLHPLFLVSETTPGLPSAAESSSNYLNTKVKLSRHFPSQTL